MNARRTLLLLLCLALVVVGVLAGCRRDPRQTGSRPTPTITPTPFSTPLPAIATNVPAGTEANPLRMMVLRLQTPGFAQAVLDFQAAMLDQGKLWVTVIPVESYADGLAALCDTETQTVSVAWLGGVSVMAASALNCGVPVLQIERGTGTNAATGLPAQIILSRRLGSSQLEALRDRNFCRLNASDFYSWLVPSLMLAVVNIDPVSDLRAVTDYPDVPALVAAVADGTCDGAGIPADAFEVYGETIKDLQDSVRVAATSAPMPYGVLMYPVALSLGVRIPLTQALVDFAADETQAEVLNILLGQDALVPVEPDDLDALRAFMDETGLDLAQLGG